MGARGCGNLHVCFVGERAQLPALRAWLALALRGQHSAGRCMAPQPARSLFELDCAGQRFASGFISIHAASGGNSPIFMTRWIARTGGVLLGLAALFSTAHRNAGVPPGRAAFLSLIAGAEQELSRKP